jgi:flagellar hook-associated protein 3 FlgL
MSVDRVTNQTQSAYLSASMMKRETAVSTLSDQVASGQVSTSYSGYGDQTMAMESARAVVNRTTAYQTATGLAVTQTTLQDDQLTQLSTLASNLQTALSSAVADGDGTTLAATCSDIFDQASAILNYKDSNGSYIYGGGNNTTEPLTLSSFNDLASLSSTALTDSTASDYAFTNGSTIKSVQVADGQSVSYGVLASDVGASLMSTLKDISDYVNNASNPTLTSTLTTAQTTFLSDEISSANTAYHSLNTITATNGDTNSLLETHSDTQTTMIDLYQGFVSDIQDVDMSTAATDLSNAKTALQAVVLVTSTLNQISLLDYLS